MNEFHILNGEGRPYATAAYLENRLVRIVHTADSDQVLFRDDIVRLDREPSADDDYENLPGIEEVVSTRFPNRTKLDFFCGDEWVLKTVFTAIGGECKITELCEHYGGVMIVGHDHRFDPKDVVSAIGIKLCDQEDNNDD